MPLYNSYKGDSLGGAINLSADATAGNLRGILLSASYVGSITSHTRYRDLSAAEISVADPGRIVGYSTGGLAISASIVCSADNGNNRGYFDAADITWGSATIVARYLAIVKVRSAGANKELDNVVGYIDFGSDQSSSNGSYQIQWNSAGIVLIT